MKVTNWFMQQPIWSFFLELGASRTLPVPAQNYLKYCFSWIVTLDYVLQKQEHLKNLARSTLFYPPYLIRDIAASYSFSWSLKITKWKTEIGSCRSSFSPCFRNWESTGPCQFLLKIVWNILFCNELHFITCSKTKNIWKFLQEVSTSTCLNW